jgi:hypothetical protein
MGFGEVTTFPKPDDAKVFPSGQKEGGKQERHPGNGDSPITLWAMPHLKLEVLS